MSCPICNEQLVQDYVDKMEHITLEYGNKCPNQHYYYQFVTGYHSEHLKHFPGKNATIAWSWKHGPKWYAKVWFRIAVRLEKIFWFFEKRKDAP